MDISSILKLFQPKDKVFFVLFEKVAENLVDMSKIFWDGIKNFDTEDEYFPQKIKDLEHKNDKITHQIYIELSKNFITPFDREDIHSLATSLDDIADYIDASTKYIFLYKSPETKDYEEFCSLIHKACLEIQIAIKNLKDFKDLKAVKEACIKINSIENIADDVQTRALIKLFESNDAISIIKIQQVLHYLEEVTDKAEDVANVLDSIIIKYA